MAGKENVYRVHMVRTVESWVDVLACDENQAMDMCLIGIQVKEDGELDARHDYAECVLGQGITVYNDDIDEDKPVEDVTEEYDLDDDGDDEDEDRVQAGDDLAGAAEDDVAQKTQLFTCPACGGHGLVQVVQGDIVCPVRDLRMEDGHPYYDVSQVQWQKSDFKVLGYECASCHTSFASVEEALATKNGNSENEYGKH